MSASEIEDAAITGAGVIIPFKAKDGKTREVTIYALKDCQLVELDAWVRARVMQTAISGVSSDMPGDLQDRIIDRAILLAAKSSYMTLAQSSGGSEFFSSVEGILQLILCSSRGGQISLADLRELCNDKVNLKLAAITFSQLNSTGQKKPNPDVEKKESLESTPEKTFINLSVQDGQT